jgi:hypothetical protein
MKSAPLAHAVQRPRGGRLFGGLDESSGACKPVAATGGEEGAVGLNSRVASAAVRPASRLRATIAMGTVTHLSPPWCPPEAPGGSDRRRVPWPAGRLDRRRACSRARRYRGFTGCARMRSGRDVPRARARRRRSFESCGLWAVRRPRRRRSRALRCASDAIRAARRGSARAARQSGRRRLIGDERRSSRQASRAERLVRAGGRLRLPTLAKAIHRPRGRTQPHDGGWSSGPSGAGHAGRYTPARSAQLRLA